MIRLSGQFQLVIGDKKVWLGAEGFNKSFRNRDTTQRVIDGVRAENIIDVVDSSL